MLKAYGTVKKKLAIVLGTLGLVLVAVSSASAQTLPTWTLDDTASSTEPFITAFKSGIIWLFQQLGPWLAGFIVLIAVFMFFRRRSRVGHV